MASPLSSKSARPTPNCECAYRFTRQTLSRSRSRTSRRAQCCRSFSQRSFASARSNAGPCPRSGSSSYRRLVPEKSSEFERSTPFGNRNVESSILSPRSRLLCRRAGRQVAQRQCRHEVEEKGRPHGIVASRISPEPKSNALTLAKLMSLLIGMRSNKFPAESLATVRGMPGGWNPPAENRSSWLI